METKQGFRRLTHNQRDKEKARATEVLNEPARLGSEITLEVYTYPAAIERGVTNNAFICLFLVSPYR